MISIMDSKKSQVRGIRFEEELWGLIVREAKKAHRTPAGHVRYLLEKEFQQDGLIQSDVQAAYEASEPTANKKRVLKGGIKKSSLSRTAQ